MIRSIFLAFALLVASAATAETPTGSLSGAWFDPETPGHGILIDQSGDTSITAFWFTYDSAGNQAWYVTDSPRPFPGVSRPVEFVLYQPTGFFPANAVAIGDPVGYLTIVPWYTLEEGGVVSIELEATWSFFGLGVCPENGIDFSPMDPQCVAGGARLEAVGGSE